MGEMLVSVLSILGVVHKTEGLGRVDFYLTTCHIH